MTREERFYDPTRVPEVQAHAKLNKLINAWHVRFSHASAREIKRILKLNFNKFHDIKASDIDHWNQELGCFCCGCAEGNMKEHARIRSTKPLVSEKPGGVTVGDIMLIEMNKNLKKPLMIHVNVHSKFFMGVPLRVRNEESCMDAVMQIKELYT
jgi:hypothetical protein